LSSLADESAVTLILGNVIASDLLHELATVVP